MNRRSFLKSLAASVLTAAATIYSPEVLRPAAVTVKVQPTMSWRTMMEDPVTGNWAVSPWKHTPLKVPAIDLDADDPLWWWTQEEWRIEPTDTSAGEVPA